MGGRTGAGCVIGSTLVIPQIGAAEPISTINVIGEFGLDYGGGAPLPAQPIVKIDIKAIIDNLIPIKTLSRNYVYPVYRCRFFNYYGDPNNVCDRANYPLLNVNVRIESNPVVYRDITCSLLHPFVKWDATMGAKKIVPAYCVETNDEIFVDPDEAMPKGIVESVTLLPPKEVYGLLVMDYDNARIASEIGNSLIPELNQILGDYWQQIVVRYGQLDLGLNLNLYRNYAALEFLEFAWNQYVYLLSGRIPPPPPGVASDDFIIITDSIASGTLYVQKMVSSLMPLFDNFC
jgi:hypothetical protein